MRAIGQGVLIVELGMIDKLTNKKYSCLLRQLKKKCYYCALLVLSKAPTTQIIHTCCVIIVKWSLNMCMRVVFQKNFNKKNTAR